MRVALFLICTYCFAFCKAQNQDRVWVFGDSVGIDFNDIENPQVFATPCTVNMECYASVSDNQGNLLFFVNGKPDGNWNDGQFLELWNADSLIEHGDSIKASWSITQGSVVIPLPETQQRYYLIHIGADSKLYMTDIDMAINNGRGRVLTKNVLIYDAILTEKMLALKHANGLDWWLITHAVNSRRLTNIIYQQVVDYQATSFIPII